MSLLYDVGVVVGIVAEGVGVQSAWVVSGVQVDWGVQAGASLHAGADADHAGSLQAGSLHAGTREDQAGASTWRASRPVVDVGGRW